LDSRSCLEHGLQESFVSSLLYLSVFTILDTMDLTLPYILFMFSIIPFHVCYDYMLSIVRIYLYPCIKLYSAHSLISWVSGQHHVSEVLRCCSPADTPYILGHVVDHGCDTPVKSFVVHSPNIVLVGCDYLEGLALFLIFLSNIPCV
jgi:hypothetical protein